MKLIELEPCFLRYEVISGWPTRIANDPLHFPEGGTHIEFRDRVELHVVKTLAEAQGVEFLCPRCFVANGGVGGTHIVICWSRSRGVPEDATPKPGRWVLEGTGLDDLTLNVEPPNTLRSVQLIGGGCKAHFNVINGDVIFC